MNKFFVAATAALLVSGSAFAGVCDNSTLGLEGEIQIVPLDNSAEVIGRIEIPDAPKTFVEFNPLTLVPSDEEGWMKAVIIETIVTPHLGAELGVVARVKAYESNGVCVVQVKDDPKISGTYSVAKKLSNGNLILTNSTDGQPDLVIKKLK